MVALDRGRLPDYMVPALFVTLESLPRTSSGKIDRRTLSRRGPERRRVQPEAAQAAPRSEIERAVAEIWKDVLGIETVGVNENFFDVGGDSAGNPLPGVARTRLGGAHQSDDGGLKSHQPWRPEHLVLVLARAKQGQVCWSQRGVGFHVLIISSMSYPSLALATPR